MKNIVKSMLIAISMYSKIPTPFVEWDEQAMQYSFCFFPIIGGIIGTLELVWWYVADIIGIHTFFFAAVVAVIPLLVTGGIHMDGYMDTMDAKHSWQSKERRLEILKDPHLGAFSVITAFVYMILYVGAATEVATIAECAMFAIGFVLSRAFSSMAFVVYEPAKKEGTFYQFAKTANKKAVFIVDGMILLLCGMGLILLHPLIGSLVFVSTAVTFFYYGRMARRYFGGVTGDLAGYFLQICELVTMLIVVVGYKIIS